jgi:hypothetical protein
MAVPTVWGFTASAGTTKTFPIEGTNLYGVDLAGTLTPVRIMLRANVYIILTAAVTDADLVSAMQDFIRNRGVNAVGGAGGFVANATQQTNYPLTTTS